MAKKPTKKKQRGPKAGDTVFLIGEKKHIAMLLEHTYTDNGLEYGFCIWSRQKMVNNELVNTNHTGSFLLSQLTLDPPPKLTDMYLI
ncbi:MAG: hypothetical protein JWO32_2044 [Bacteroidetes bacterium]|nr:hypothetical protein [Bacteroidota bacterium]